MQRRGKMWKATFLKNATKSINLPLEVTQETTYVTTVRESIIGSILLQGTVAI